MPEGPAAKRQRELVQKTSEEALRRGLEVRRSAAAARAKIPAAIKPRVFWPKTRLPAAPRYGLKSWCYLYAIYLIAILMWFLYAFYPAVRPQGVPVTPSSPSRTRSLEPQVAGEALVDDAPPVTDTRAGSPLHTTEGVETSVGGSGRRPPQQS
jgi:hypothetical protein